MEWVEVTGRTVEEAKDQALDRLGVDERDAEFEVIEEDRVVHILSVSAAGPLRSQYRRCRWRAF